MDVASVELPVLVGLLDAVEEAPTLLVLGQVQEQLDDAVALVAEVALPVVDLAEAPVPDITFARARRQLLVGQDLRVDADHEDLLVVGAVEDTDVAAGWQPARIAPQVVVVELLGRGHLEGVDLDALRVDTAHDVADGAVLAGSIDGLDDHQQAVGVLGGQARLVLGQQLDALGQELLGLILAPRTHAGWVEVPGQPHAPTRLDAEGPDELGDALRPQLRHRWIPLLVNGIDETPLAARRTASACDL